MAEVGPETEGNDYEEQHYEQIVPSLLQDVQDSIDESKSSIAVSQSKNPRKASLMKTVESYSVLKEGSTSSKKRKPLAEQVDTTSKEKRRKSLFEPDNTQAKEELKRTLTSSPNVKRKA